MCPNIERKACVCFDEHSFSRDLSTSRFDFPPVIKVTVKWCLLVGVFFWIMQCCTQATKSSVMESFHNESIPNFEMRLPPKVLIVQNVILWKQYKVISQIFCGRIIHYIDVRMRRGHSGMVIMDVHDNRDNIVVHHCVEPKYQIFIREINCGKLYKCV